MRTHLRSRNARSPTRLVLAINNISTVVIVELTLKIEEMREDKEAWNLMLPR